MAMSFVPQEVRDKISKTLKGRKISEEHKIKIGLANKGKVLSDDAKRKIGLANKGKVRSDETKIKISAASSGRKLSDETKERIRQGNLGRTAWNKGKKLGPRSEEVKKKIGDAHRGKTISDEHKKMLSEFNTGKVLSEETKRKIGIASLGNKSNLGRKASDETKAKKSEIFKGEKNPFYGKTHTEEVRRKISENSKGRTWSDERKIEMSLKLKGRPGKLHTEAAKDIMKVAARNRWLNPNYVETMKKARRIQPNKKEIVVMNLLNELYPNQWKYTGDFSFSINGKSPDFTNCNGKKKLVEFFGDYWHQGEDPQIRKDIFREFGYDTLVIWQHELKNINQVKFRIIRFCER